MTCAATLRAAQKRRLTHPEKASRHLPTLPRERTALTATALPSKPEHRTTAAGDVQPEARSPLQSKPKELRLSDWPASVVQGSRSLSNTHSLPSRYTDSECTQVQMLVNWWRRCRLWRGPQRALLTTCMTQLEVGWYGNQPKQSDLHSFILQTMGSTLC